MNDYIKRAVLTGFTSLSFFIAFAVGAAPVLAQNTAGLQLKPAVVEDNVGPGEFHNYSITATNLTNADVTYYLSVQDIKGVDDQGRPVFAANGEKTGFELSSWISLPQSQVTIPAGGARTINFSVQVPANASPGSHFASVFLSDKPDEQQTTGAAVGFSVGSIVSLQIAGDIHESAQLIEFSTGKLVYGNADIDFNSKVQNIGNVLVQPNGVIEVTDMFGKKVADITVNDALASVFPSSSRTFAAQWQQSGFAFGRYEAVASLAYGTEARKTIYGTTSFWILPLVPIATVLGILLVVILGAYALMRAYIRRKLREMGVPNATRADAEMYRRKYQKSGSRLIIIAMVTVLVCIVLLILLFLMFA